MKVPKLTPTKFVGLMIFIFSILDYFSKDPQIFTILFPYSAILGAIIGAYIIVTGRIL